MGLYIVSPEFPISARRAANWSLTPILLTNEYSPVHCSRFRDCCRHYDRELVRRYASTNVGDRFRHKMLVMSKPKCPRDSSQLAKMQSIARGTLNLIGKKCDLVLLVTVALWISLGVFAEADMGGDLKGDAVIERLLAAFFKSDGRGSYRSNRLLRWEKSSIDLWLLGFDQADQASELFAGTEFMKTFRSVRKPMYPCLIGREWIQETEVCSKSQNFRADIFYVNARTPDQLDQVETYLLSHLDQIEVQKEALEKLFNDARRAYGSGIKCYVSWSVASGAGRPAINAALVADAFEDQADSQACASMSSFQVLGVIPDRFNPENKTFDTEFATLALKTLYSPLVQSGASIDETRALLRRELQR